MATKLELSQQTTSFSVPRTSFIQNVVMNTHLSKTDYRVLCLLLTELDGWNKYERAIKSTTTPDPLNFQKLNLGNIALTLGLEKSDVKKSVKKLLYEGILEEGSSGVVKDGYRFTF